jgi:hypothetical protein
MRLYKQVEIFSILAQNLKLTAISLSPSSTARFAKLTYRVILSCVYRWLFLNKDFENSFVGRKTQIMIPKDLDFFEPAVLDLSKCLIEVSITIV